MMAILLFSILSLLASIMVICAAILSSRLSEDEDWTERYDNSETSENHSPPMPAHSST